MTWAPEPGTQRPSRSGRLVTGALLALAVGVPLQAWILPWADRSAFVPDPSGVQWALFWLGVALTVAAVVTLLAIGGRRIAEWVERRGALGIRPTVLAWLAPFAVHGAFLAVIVGIGAVVAVFVFVLRPGSLAPVFTVLGAAYVELQLVGAGVLGLLVVRTAIGLRRTARLVRAGVTEQGSDGDDDEFPPPPERPTGPARS